MSILSEVEGFVKKELADIGADLKSAEAKLEDVATVAVNVLNAAKTFVTTNPVGETLLSVVEAVPGIGTIASEIVNVVLPKAVSAATTVEADASDPIALVSAGLTAIGKNTDADEVTAAYNTIAGLLTNKIAPALNVASTIQSALSIVQTVYAKVKAAV